MSCCSLKKEDWRLVETVDYHISLSEEPQKSGNLCLHRPHCPHPLSNRTSLERFARGPGTAPRPAAAPRSCVSTAWPRRPRLTLLRLRRQRCETRRQPGSSPWLGHLPRTTRRYRMFYTWGGPVDTSGISTRRATRTKSRRSRRSGACTCWLSPPLTERPQERRRLLDLGAAGERAADKQARRYDF